MKKNEIKRDYVGQCEIVGKVSIADQIRENHIRSRNNAFCEVYIKAIVQDCESEDAFFNGYFYEIRTPQFNLVTRS